MIKNLPAMKETWVQPLDWEDPPPREGNGSPFQYTCLENPRRQGRLVGYSPWRLKELDMIEQLSVQKMHDPV